MDDLKIPNEFLTPPNIVSFIKELCLEIPANTILDPACGSANLLTAVANNKADVELTGVEINQNINTIAEKTLKESGLKHNLINANFFSLHLDDKFDLVVCNPPFGMRLEKEIDGLKIKRAEQAFILLSLQALNPNGYAIFIVPEGLLFDNLTAFKEYISQKYSLQAIISLPAGSFPYTGIKTSIVVIKNSIQTEKVFFAEFAEYQALNTIITNFHKKITNKNISQGFWIDFEDIEKNNFVWTYTRYKDIKDFESQKPDSKFLSKPLSKLALIGGGKLVSNDSIMIQRVGYPPKIIMKSELPKTSNPKNYIELSIISDEIIPQYLRLYLNSEKGKAQFLSLVRSSSISSLRVKDVENIYIEIPDLETQIEIISSEQKILEVSTSIQIVAQNFYSQLFNYQELLPIIEGFNKADESDVLFENLIAPLAMSFRIATKSSPNINSQLDSYFKMFEMIAVLNSIVLLSALPYELRILYEKNIWAEKKSFSKVSFGSWIGLYRRLSNLYKQLISSDEKKKPEERLFTALPFGLDFYLNLSNQELLSFLEGIPEKRNKPAHGGIFPEVVTQKAINEIHPILVKVFEKLNVAYSALELIYPQTMKKSSGLYTIKIKKLQGTDYPYAEQEVQMETDLNTESLYLYNPISKNRLELLPEFVKLVQCESCGHWSVYFYNKTDDKKSQYISYQNEIHEYFTEPVGLLNLFITS